jgi:integrase
VTPPGRAHANKLFAPVSAMWNAAARLHDLGGKNPAKRLTPSALAPRTTRIDDDAFTAWYARVTAADMNPVRRDLQLVSLFTGIRSDGIRQLRWDDLDEERRLIHVRKAKGDKPYTLPLVETVRSILERRRAENARTFAPWGGDHGWCFPTLSRAAPFHVIPVSEVKEHRTDRAREDKEGRPLRVLHLPGIHANRRTFNSVAIEIGIPPEARLALMNHEGKGVNVKHYGVPQSWDFLRECAQRIEAALRERLEMPPIAPAAPAAPAAPPSNVVPILRAAS